MDYYGRPTGGAGCGGPHGCCQFMRFGSGAAVRFWFEDAFVISDSVDLLSVPLLLAPLISV